MRLRRSFILSVPLLLAILSLARPAAGQIAGGSEWKLKVTVDAAVVRLKPDLQSPAIAVLSKGAPLTAYEAEGAWYRIVLPPGRDGVLLIGYVASNEVEVIEEKTRTGLNYWAEETEVYRGIGLRVRLTGAWTYFGGGDITAGAKGMFELGRKMVADGGFKILSQNSVAYHSGYSLGAEFIYDLGPRLGIGIGGWMTNAMRIDTVQFEELNIFQQAMESASDLRVYSFRVGLHYAVPLGGRVVLRLHGGPVLSIVKYDYNRSYATTNDEESFYLKITPTRLGFLGGATLEVNVNDRIALIVDGRGRYARMGNLSGLEHLARYVNNFGVPDIDSEGTLYALDENGSVRLTAQPGPPSGGTKAVLDLSGFDLAIGFQIRF